MGLEILHAYTNGGFHVSIFSDGTKVRRSVDPDRWPEVPEQIDLKITDWCDGGCPWCHEGSTVRGGHATATWIEMLLQDLPPGVEIAIGGGDPVSHPEFQHLCKRIRKLGLIPNVTINAQHFHRHREILEKLVGEGCLFGVGISVHDAPPPHWDYEHCVYHFIIGVHDPDDTRTIRRDAKILLLGYKELGRGASHISRIRGHIDASAKRWAEAIRTMVMDGRIVSMDRLAIVQTCMHHILRSNEYMGDDGQFSMYIDAVRQEFSASSYSHLRRRLLSGIRSAFRDIQIPPLAGDRIRKPVFETNSSSSHSISLSADSNLSDADEQIRKRIVLCPSYGDFYGDGTVAEKPEDKAAYLMLASACVDLFHDDALSRAYDLLKHRANEDGTQNVYVFNKNDYVLLMEMPTVYKAFCMMDDSGRPVEVDLGRGDLGYIDIYACRMARSMLNASPQFFRNWLWSSGGIAYTGGESIDVAYEFAGQPSANPVIKITYLAEYDHWFIIADDLTFRDGNVPDAFKWARICLDNLCVAFTDAALQNAIDSIIDALRRWKVASWNEVSIRRHSGDLHLYEEMVSIKPGDGTILVVPSGTVLNNRSLDPSRP